MDDNKKELLAILQELKTNWPLAGNLSVLVEEANDHNFLDALGNIFSQALKHVQDTTLKKSLEAGIIYIKQMQVQEKKEYEDELKNLDVLVDNL